MEEQRPNFFILLDLNPNDAWNPETYRQALKTKQAKWNQDRMGMGRNVRAARENIELIPEIERVMNDPVLRKKEMQAARMVQMDAQERVEQREARMMDFEQRLRSLEKKGYLLDEELTALIAEFDDVLTRKEIIRQINVGIYDPGAGLAETLAELPLTPSTLEDIDEKLAVLHISDLYALLRLSRAASQQELLRYAEIVHDEYTRQQPKTVSVEAGTSLAGHAKNIFSSRKKRQEYDEHLTHRAELQKTEQRTPKSPTQQTQPVAAAPVGDISDLHIRNIGTALRLTWKWPDNCYQALVAFSNEAWPDPQSNKGSVLKVTKAEYEAGGHYDLYVPADNHYFIRVMALFSSGSRLLRTDGERGQEYFMPHIVIRYEIKNPGFGHKQRTLILYTTALCKIPTLVLRCKRNGQPLNKGEGEELHREVGPIEVMMEKTIPLPATPFPNTFAKLFLENDQYYAFVTIHHPQERKLRLG